MAIKIDVNFKGILVEGAYVTVMQPAVSTDKSEITFGAWHRSAIGQEAFLVVFHAAPYDLEGDNPFEQAYAYLKTLLEFEGAEDC